MTHIEKLEAHWRTCKQPSYLPDVKFVSFPRSGRTWYMYMVQTVALELGLKSHHNLFYFGHGSTSIHTSDTRKRYEKSKKRIWGKKKVILLVRHPLDVAISGYHYLWTRLQQGRLRKIGLSGYIRSESRGLPYIVEFMNDWVRAYRGAQTRGMLFVLYEHDPRENLQRIFEFAGVEVEDRLIDEALRLCSFGAVQEYDAERRMVEVQQEIRMQEGKRVSLEVLRSTPNALFARKGLPYGFMDELKQDDIEWGRDYLTDTLDSFYENYVKP